jgi:hypothetical protein
MSKYWLTYSTSMKAKRSVLKVDSRLAYLVGWAKKGGKQRYIMLTLKEAEDILAYIRKEIDIIPESVRYRD